MAFLDRQITLTFTLGTGSFGTTGSNTLTVSGLRVNATISNAGGPDMGSATVRVHGLTASNLRDLCTVVRLANGTPQVTLNYLTISAGDASMPVASYPKVYQGQITVATIDMESIPDSVLTCTCNAGGFEAVFQTVSHSYPEGTDVYTVMEALAGLAVPALNFEGNNTHVSLHKQYLWGSLNDQIKQAAQAAKINWTIENGTLAIWPKGGSRTQSSVIPSLSYDDGTLLGYPMNWNFGAGFKTTFNPHLFLGGLVNCKSTLDFATGQFIIADVTHEIDSQVPGGRWFTYFHGTPANVSSS